MAFDLAAGPDRAPVARSRRASQPTGFDTKTG